jgi:hypothetical protein
VFFFCGCSVLTAAGVLSSNCRNEHKGKREGWLDLLGPPVLLASFLLFFFLFFFCCENKFLYCIVGPIVCVPLQLGHIDSSYGARTKKLELEIHSCRLSSLIA